MKKNSFMQKEIRELLQLLETIQRDAVQFPGLQPQAAKLITIVKSMGRWMVYLDASKHATIITWLATFAGIVLEKHGAPRIDPYSIPVILATMGSTVYSMKQVKKQTNKLITEADNFKNITRATLDFLNKISSGSQKQK